MLKKDELENLSPEQLLRIYEQLQREKRELDLLRRKLERQNHKARQRTIDLFGKMIDVKKAQKIIQQQKKELEVKNKEIERQKASLERTFQKFRQRTIELFGKIIDLKKAYNIINQQKKEIEQHRRQLHEINSAKDKFFSIIAHDLKNPIAGFMGLTEVMTHQSDDLTPEELKNFASMMYDSAKQLYSLLENLLHWSRAQTGMLKVNLKPMELIKSIHEAECQLRTMAEIKEITFRNSFEASMMVYADQDMLNTVVRNLLSNAIKFSQNQSYIDIIISYNEKVAMLTIKDYGVGIANEDLPKLFKIDTNPTKIGTSQEKGTGLGLILCHEFMSRMNGSISVESELGKGAAFTITIPLANNE